MENKINKNLRVFGERLKQLTADYEAMLRVVDSSQSTTPRVRQPLKSNRKESFRASLRADIKRKGSKN